MIELLVKHNFEVLSPVYKGRWTWIRLYVQGFHCKLLLTVAGQQQIKKTAVVHVSMWKSSFGVLVWKKSERCGELTDSVFVGYRL